ncbi:MAG: hypothetical protein Q8N97_05205 [Methanobacteriaceae archaeon]|nr:hypothetical protein [Methanobacteriaceae archaeon]
MTKKEDMLKEMDMIQNIINRMASNSFLIKGWAITLVSVTLLLKGDKYQVLIAFIPLFTFWYLDTYFLWMERKYIILYNWIIANRLKTSEHLFDMNPHRFDNEKQYDIDSMKKVAVSKTLLSFYGSILAAILIYCTIILLIPCLQSLCQK